MAKVASTHALYGPWLNYLSSAAINKDGGGGDGGGGGGDVDADAAGEPFIWKVSALLVTTTTTITLVDVDPPTVTLNGRGVSVELIRTHNGSTICARFYRAVLATTQKDEETKNEYTVNGKIYSYYVPAKGSVPVILYTSCNGFDPSTQKKADKVKVTITNTWLNVAEVHNSRSGQHFHVGLGGGDQLYCDCLLSLPGIKKTLKIKRELLVNLPFSVELESEVADYYLECYLKGFSDRGYSECLSSIPHMMQWDDHDIFDGFGSYPEDLQTSPLFQGIGTTAAYFYWLFQHHIFDKEADAVAKGYFSAKSTTCVREICGGVVVVGLDGRSNRSVMQVSPAYEYATVLERLGHIINSSLGIKHVLVMSGIPIVYPQMELVMKALKVPDPREQYFEKKNKKWQREDDSGIMASLWRKFGMCWGKLTSKSGLLTGFETVDLMDDIVDHWEGTHDTERISILQQFADFQLKKRVRVTFLSGDVHVAALSRLVIPSSVAGSNNDVEASKIYNLISSPVGNLPGTPVRVLSKTLFNKIDPVPLPAGLFGSGGEAKGELKDWLASDGHKNESGIWDNNDNFIDKRNWLELRAVVGTDYKAILHVEDELMGRHFTTYYRDVPSIKK